jgi:hemoglobin
MTVTADTPYELIGGEPVVRAIVDRFYDIMDEDADCAALRALHAPDLNPMRESLSGFLNGWLGGPRDWFQQNPGVCMMSAHGKVNVTPETAAQWTRAMGRALADCGVRQDLREALVETFSRMSAGMAIRGR